MVGRLVHLSICTAFAQRAETSRQTTYFVYTILCILMKEKWQANYPVNFLWFSHQIALVTLNFDLFFNHSVIFCHFFVKLQVIAHWHGSLYIYPYAAFKRIFKLITFRVYVLSNKRSSSKWQQVKVIFLVPNRNCTTGLVHLLVGWLVRASVGYPFFFFRYQKMQKKDVR